MRGSELMSRQVATVRSSDSASVAGRLMWDCDCGAVPVIDEDGRAIGMVTDRDICMSAVHENRAPSDIPVSQAMSRTLHACNPNDSVRAAGELMRKFQIRRIPVLDGQSRPIGILSLADVVRATDGRKAEMRDLPPQEITATLANICSPRAPASDGHAQAH